MDFKVPGNILLLGEYSILEENSRAITAAVYPCATWKNQNTHLLSGEQKLSQWNYKLEETLQEETKGNIFSSCWQVLQTYSKNNFLSLSKTGVHISTSSFASNKGKIGFGSSAAATIACLKGLLKGQSWGKILRKDEFRQLAFQAHNIFQGKVGSGYDVYTSDSYGFNMFENGEIKTINNIHLSFLPHIYVYKSPHTVSTIKAVQKYKEWQINNPTEAISFIKSSNLYIDQFCKADNWKIACDILKQATELGIWIGKKIGVPAEVFVPEELNDFDDTIWKGSGAGNELPLIFSNHDLTIFEGMFRVIPFEEIHEDNQNEI